MSNLTIISDTIRSKLKTLFSNKTEIPNPYSISDNAYQFLNNGFGVAIKSGTQSVIDTFCNNFEQRNFDIILSRVVYRNEVTNDSMFLESEYILEDSILVKNMMLDFNQMGIDDNIEIVKLSGDDGINFIFSGDHSFIYTTISFTIDYKIY